MQILVQNDADVPQDFLDDEQAAINILNAAFTNTVTITIKVGYGNYNGTALPSQNMSQGGINFGYFLTYQQLRTDLLTFGEPGLFNDTNLPNATSINEVSNFMVSSSVAKIFGIPTTLSNIDGFVGIGTDLSGPVRISAFLHEFGHALGRVPDIMTSGGTQYFSELDLWRFTAPGQRYFDGNFTTTASTYFSLDGGALKIANWGRTSNDSDFLNDTLTGNDPFNEIVGDFANLTQSDLYITEALGFRHSPPSNPPGNPPPPAGTTADMILRHGSDGKYQIYDIGQNRVLASYSLGQVGTDWDFHGLGGFFGQDTTDMMLRNSSTGDIEIYDISNNNIANAALLGAVGLDWQLMGHGNFSGGGETDMMLRRSSDGMLLVYDIRNHQIIGTNFMGAVGLDWQVAGFGNFSSRGTSDMILRNANTGALLVYDIASNQVTGSAFMGVVGLEWSVLACGNFSSRPGATDMIMRNANNGVMMIYDINNNQITSTHFIGAVGLDWQFAGVAPVGGAGASDLVLRNVNTGAFQVYNIASNSLIGSVSLGAVGLDWSLGGLAVSPPTGLGGAMDQPVGGAMNASDDSTSQLLQAMAVFGGEAGAAADLTTAASDAEAMQQFLATPQYS
jgi:hypothetical protein